MSKRLRIFSSGLTPSGVLASGLAVLAALPLLAPPARAQLALPGAVAPAPEGSIASEPGKKPRARRSGDDEAARGPAIAPKPPSEDSLIGKPLQLDGTRSTIEFQRGAELQVKKLTLLGDRIARSGESCAIAVEGMPMRLVPRDSDKGLRRYQLDFPACPFTFDVLDGAILASNGGKACELKQADCRADPAGLWGTGENDFDPKRSKDMLGTRARVEKTVRADFRALYDKNKKDLPLRKYLVREQAGFSSWREEICRSYAHESDYGYCALRLTEARALALGTQLAKGVKLPPGAETALAEEAEKKAKRKK